MEIKLKRAYETQSTTDGYRIFVDKLWPRGESKEEFHYDLWAKEIAPSTDLRKYFHEDPTQNWESFKTAYLKELATSTYIIQFIDDIKDKAIVTLLYSAKDEEHNNAVVLKEYLEKVLS